jgi:hypothetical protein
MLAVHVQYVMYGWKRNPSESLKDSLPPLTNVLQIEKYLSRFRTPQLTRTAVVSHYIHYVQESVQQEAPVRYAFCKWILQRSV